MWLKRLFCGDTITELEKCKSEQNDLKGQIKQLKQLWDDCLTAKSCCINELAETYDKIAKLTEDVGWFRARLATMEKTLKDAIIIPELDLDESELIVLKPYEEEVFSEYDFKAADLEYYLLTYNKWVEILTPVQKEVKEALVSWKTNISDCVIPSELGWGLGLFLADGTCGLNREGGYGGAFWRIVNGNIEYLERAKQAFGNFFPEVRFKINEYPSYNKGASTNFGERKQKLYCLDVYANKRERDEKGRYIHGGRGKFIERFYNDFYFLGEKKIPACLWDKGNRNPKLEFLNGFIAGDGRHHKKGWQVMYVHSPSVVTGLIECMINVGWKFNIRRHKGGFRINVDRRREYVPFLMDYIYEKGEITFKDVAEWLEKHYPNRDISYALKILEGEGFIKRLLKRTSTGRSQRIKALKPYPEACDDWAYVMGATLVQAFAKADLDKQGAFMITWSRTHAYNAFMDIYKRVWIYEPQNNTVVGKLQETTDSYKTEMIWFPGARL